VIPEIGVMIGLYIVTRMLAITLDKAKAGSVRVFGAITLIVAVLVIADLAVRGATAGEQLQQFMPR
jgi:hypothetical protein